MKIAIVHDHLLQLGGAERVLVQLVKMYPAADLFLGLVDQKILNQLSTLKGRKIVISPWNFLAQFTYIQEWLKPLIVWYWEQLDLSSYDLVISSSHSFSAKSVRTQPQTFHVAYIHTPPRYLYTEMNYSQWIRWPIIRQILQPFLTVMRYHDRAAAQRPNLLIANSQTTQKRIQTYYGRTSQVVYPPIEIPRRRTINQLKKKKYFICVSRLVKQKGMDIAVRACTQLQVPLVVVGTGPEEKYLQRIAGPTITFAGFVSDEKMTQLYQHALALIYCSNEEDFGMVPVEAMGHGIPVIAYRSGGVTETVVEGQTGRFFGERTVESLVDILAQFRPEDFSPRECYNRALHFSVSCFVQEIKKVIRHAK